MWKHIAFWSKTWFFSFFYPSFCLHCEEKIKDQGLLCPFCFEMVELCSLDIKDKTLAPFTGIASTIEPQGAGLSLLRSREGNEAALIAKAMAAWMVIALERYGWPKFDYLIPDPNDLLFHRILAKEMGLFLGVPVVEELFISFWNKKLFLRKKVSLEKQTVLIVSAIKPKSLEPFLFLQDIAAKDLFFLSF